MSAGEAPAAGARPAADPITVARLEDPAARSRLCAEIIVELPDWFGRPTANAAYIHGAADRPSLAACCNSRHVGLVVLEPDRTGACVIWWLGVRPEAHRLGVGRALVAAAAQEAGRLGCRRLIVETLSPRWPSAAYDATRRFYRAVGFVPWLEIEAVPGEPMLWMRRRL